MSPCGDVSSSRSFSIFVCLGTTEWLSNPLSDNDIVRVPSVGGGLGAHSYHLSEPPELQEGVTAFVLQFAGKETQGS